MADRPLFGPGGNSESFYAEGKKHTLDAPAWLAGRGLDAYEYQAGNGITGSPQLFEKIGKEAKRSVLPCPSMLPISFPFQA